MHVSVTRVATGDLPIETATIVAQEMMRWFRESDGFEGGAVNGNVSCVVCDAPLGSWDEF